MLWQAGAWREELIQLLELLAERADRRLHPPALGLAGAPARARPLQPDRNRSSFRLFITLRKSEALFSPTTRYRDLALGSSLFHWESQSTTTASSTTGQRYVSGTSRVLLFVREQRKRDGRPGAPTEPFVCLGFASYESHEGERPMAIRWRLEREIPAAWLPVMALAV